MGSKNYRYPRVNKKRCGKPMVSLGKLSANGGFSTSELTGWYVRGFEWR
jgi:hypothetical protein